jgi:uncharacterized LabA/DUF88 family protein
MLGNYFFIDGSALTAQIRQLRRADPSFRNRRLCPRAFISYFIAALPELHGQEYKRLTFYFPTGDEAALGDYLVMPDHKKPGEIRDLHFKFCGQKLKRSAEFDKFIDDHVPPRFHDRFAKSEKGIDIEICCDALKLASASRIERLFLLSNDSDFIPFCRTIKEFGANISIIHLSETLSPNADLLQQVDSYDVVPKGELQRMFLPHLTEAPAPVLPEAVVSAEKPDVVQLELTVEAVPEDKSKPAMDAVDVEVEPSEAK